VSTKTDLWALTGIVDRLQRYSDTISEATAGFDSLKFQTADRDPRSGNRKLHFTGETMYFIPNSDYLEMVVIAMPIGRLGREKCPANQNATGVSRSSFPGAVYRASNRALQARLVDASYRTQKQSTTFIGTKPDSR